MIVWAAGFIDGEGSILLSHNKRNENRSPTVSASNTCLPMLEGLKKLFGGYICCHGKRKKRHAVAYSWRVPGNKAMECLKELVPYLQHPLKQRKGNLVLSTYKQVTQRNGKYTDAQLSEKRKFEKAFFAIKN